MSDQWIGSAVKRIKQTEEDKRAEESYALLRERMIYAQEDKLFSELQKVLKETVAKLNEQFPGQGRFDIKTRFDEIELIGPKGISFDIKQDSKSHELSLMLWQGNDQQPRHEDTVSLDLGKDEEVHYVLGSKSRPMNASRLAEHLLDLLINYSL